MFAIGRFANWIHVLGAFICGFILAHCMGASEAWLPAIFSFAITMLALVAVSVLVVLGHIWPGTRELTFDWPFRPLLIGAFIILVLLVAGFGGFITAAML